ncbi:hypothetical protein ACFRKD_17855 [Streptomyces niveus]|uniref:hypothetical protein n=1 Tax=Streptomyces niveus TaxID=193462 RepID=UPI0036CCA252
MLHPAFEGLGARSKTSGALADNVRLDRAGWEAHRTVPVELRGLEPALALFGL